MQEQKPFKARLGFNANGSKIINVANPENNNDALNLEYFEYYNTIEPYRQDRGYPKGFAVIYNNRLYVSNKAIQEPSGRFDYNDWNEIDSISNWKYINSNVTNNYESRSGEDLLISTLGSNLNILLPGDPIQGEGIRIKDIGGELGKYKLTITSKTANINSTKGKMSRAMDIVIPFSLIHLTFNNGYWEPVLIKDHHKTVINIQRNNPKIEASSGTTIINTHNNIHPEITLPSYANHGDSINFINTSPSSPLVKFLAPESNHRLGINGNKETILLSYNPIKIIYDAERNLWNISKSSSSKRHNIISSGDYNLKFHESVYLVDQSDIGEEYTLNLPKILEHGIYDNEVIHIDFEKVLSNSKVTLKSPDKNILFYNTFFGQQKFKDANNIKYSIVDEIVILPFDMRIKSLKILYLNGHWNIIDTNYKNIFVDSSFEELAGIISIATQDDMLEDIMLNDNVAITPKKLQQRTSNEKRAGIAYIASQDEVNEGNDDSKIITPKKLNERRATYNLTGIAKLATDKELEDGHEGSIVSPKVLRDKLVNYKPTTQTDGLIINGNMWNDLSIDIKTSTKGNKGIVKLFNKDIFKPLGDTQEGLVDVRGDEDLVITNNDINDILDLYLPKEATSFNTNRVGGTHYNKVVRNVYNIPSDGGFFEDNFSNLEFIFQPDSPELEESLSWLDPPPSNYTEEIIQNGSVSYIYEDEPLYERPYYYKRTSTDNIVFETLRLGNDTYNRTIIKSGDVIEHNGWVRNYNILNKPKPIDIGAIDKDDIIIGKIQLEEYLDILVDEETRLRIFPDKEEKKVGFAWITKQK